MEDPIEYGKGKYMDTLPTVISCCFCCFLRAGSVVIAIVSFIIGIILAPNVSHTRGPWTLGVINTHGAPVEMYCQLVLGMISIFLCIISILLVVGSLCNVPKCIEAYQWGAIIYCGTTVIIFLTLSTYCFAIHGNCLTAGLSLLFLVVANVLLTAYFVLVVNSLRMSMTYLNNTGIIDT